MLRALFVAASLAPGIVSAFVAESQTTTLSRHRAFTARDAVEAVRVIVPDLNSSFLQDRYPKVSPDGTRFFIVTFQGDVESGANQFRLQVVQTSGGSSVQIHDDAVVQFDSSTNSPGIATPKWINDQEIVFLGARNIEKPQVFLWNVKTQQLTQRTHSASGVRSFWSSQRGDLIFLTEPVQDVDHLQKVRASGYVVTNEHYPILLASDKWAGEVVNHASSVHYLPHDSDAPVQIKGLELFSSYLHVLDFWLFPETRRAVAFAPTYAHLDRWRGYRNATINSFLRRLEDTGRSKSAQMGFVHGEYLSIDLDTGSAQPFVVAPGSIYKHVPTQAIAIPGTRSVIVTNAMVPLNQIGGRDTDAHEYPALLEVDIDSGRVNPITYLRDERVVLRSMEWDRQTRSLIVIHTIGSDGATAVESYRKVDSRWKAYRKTTRVDVMDRSDGFIGLRSNSLLAGISQGLNDPPRLIVKEAVSGQTLYVRELNPAFREIEMVKMDVVEWQDERGMQWRGGLMYPSHHDPSRRYPLVIQTHGFNPSEFLIDGMMFGGKGGAKPGAFSGQSARALAAKGFFVLQEYDANSKARSIIGTREEGRQYVASYRAIIRDLTQRGLVDPQKVGLHGFSRTSYHVKYVLAHADYPIAAASVSDGLDFGYLQTMLAGPSSWPMDLARTIYGTPPVADGLKTWMADAPTFNMNRIRAPVRIEANSYPASEWEMYAGLKLLGIPTEITVYPDGLHRLIKPGERLRSQQGNVDWFSFWINGEEDPAAEKADQYARWRAMREMWKAAQMEK